MATAEGPQRCLYEILGIELTSTADEIRTAYRKLALKLHPDKAIQSGASQEEATARFQEILRAYEVLSDPRERSWYDSHRSQILYSSASSSSAKNCDFDINLWPYFSTSVYSGYGDTGKGFFSVYGDIFQKLFQQEIAYAHSMGTDPVPEAPLFGNLKSPYAQVSAFYNYWLGFSTVKDFTWVDEFRVSAGPNRKTRRLMEEENKKLRKKAKREYNETVRQLAEFVKKRDKRVLERQLQRKKEEEAKAAQAKLRREKLEKEKLARARQYEEQEWARVDEGEEVEEVWNRGSHDGWYDHDVKGKKGSESGQPGGNPELYCIVCSKKFKSDKQWKNHEQSKKHRDRVMELKDMFEEDSLLDGIVNGVDERLDCDSPVQEISEDTRAHGDSIAAELDDLGIDEGSTLGEQPDCFEDNSSDFEEDNKTSIHMVTRDFSVLENTEEFEESGTAVEHFDNLPDDSNNASDKSSVEDEEEKIENNTKVNSSDEEHEIDNSDVDDEASLLEAMLKTLTAKRGANNVYRDTASTEADGTDYSYRGNDEEYSSTNQRSRHSNKVEPSTDLGQPDTDNGTQNDKGISRPAQRQGSKNKSKQRRMLVAGADKHPATDIVEEAETRSQVNLGDRQQGTEFCFPVDKHADELEGDSEKGRLRKPEKQSVEKKSATENTSAKELSAKAKKQVKGKKGKASTMVLDLTPFSFAIELAALASKREFLNLEKWLNDNLSSQRDKLFEACLKFLRERTLFEASNDSLGNPVQRSGPIVNLSLETTAILFKVLQANVGQLASRDLAEEMKRLHSATVHVNPRLLSVGASEQSSSEVFAADIEEEANSYFQQTYIGQLTMDDVIEKLAHFKESSEKREKEIFACMIHNLFDEYRFFPRYPERELEITAILFGSLIKHQLVSSLTLGMALRVVLDALRKPLDSKMFSFGLTALEQFRDRLVEWPQYCNHIMQISHVRDAHGELVDFIDRSLARISSSQPEQSGGNPASTDQNQNSMSLPSDTNESSEASWQSLADPTTTQSALVQRQQAGLANYVKQSSLAPTGQSISVNGWLDANAGLKSSQAVTSQQSGSGSTSMISSQGFLCSSRGSTAPAIRQTLNSFGHALNIETLVAAAERRDTPIEAPSSEVNDKIAFMINNISTTNLEAKSKEFLEVLKELYYPWFAQYMVMKRASIEPNFHDLYLKFLDKINSKALHKEIIKATYENCKVLLRSELIKSSSEERSLLKNLGSWLGKLTIGRNQALRAREIDPKLLIIEAYEKGLMIAVIPFTSKILEPCQSSLAYQPPNPWTMGILSLLAEIYALPNLKMNLKFDIEVLFKNLGVDTKDVKPTQLLKGRAREVEGNPDFSNKDLGTAQQQVVTEHTTGSIVPISQVELQPEVSTSRASTPHPPVLNQFTGALHLSSSTVGEEEKVSTLAMPDRVPAGLGLQHATPAQSPYSVNQMSMSFPNIGSYVVVNPKLTALGQQLPFQRVVHMGMDRAIREIISPVVERSVTIACMTTRELVTKDYAMESEESRIRHSSNLMVASLAGSLAHVTCKEPLRVAMVTQLKSMLQAFSVIGDVLDQTVSVITNDNLDLGCAVIEQAATEKALRDLDEVIGHPLSVRRKQRETMGAAYFDASVYSQGNLARLPEALRPKPGRLSPAQQRVYEDFARLPWQNQSTQNITVPPVVTSSSSAASVGSGFPRVVYGSGSAQASSSGYSATQAIAGLSGIAQSLEQSAEEMDSRATSPHSASSSQVAMADGGMRHVADALSMTSSFTTSAVVEGHVVDGSNSMKESASIVRPSTPSLTVERLNSTGLEPSINTGEALDKYQVVSQKLEAAISKGASDHEIQGLVSEIPDIILQCISRDEAALAIAQKVFKKLYENPSNSLHVSTHIAVLVAIRDVCKRVLKELTSWVVYSDEERKFNKEITVALIHSELINLTEYNMHLAKLVDGGRNAAATDFAIFLVQTCVIQDPGVSASELYNLIEALGKVAQRPDSPGSLQQLIEDVRNVSSNAASQNALSVGKEEKARQSRDKKAILGRVGTTRDDSKLTSRDGGSADPAGFRDQVVILFDDWARICDSPGVNDKAYAVYISQLQQSGMLKGDDISDRFFRVLTELSVAHCLASEISVSGPISSQQMTQGLSFTAIDMYSKLVVLLVKYCAVDPGMSKVNLLNKVLAVTVRVIQRDVEDKKSTFHPRPYFRLFVNWLMDFNSPDPALDASNFQVLTAFANAFHSLQPLRVPGWSFAWLELISHRSFMPKLLLSNSQKGWPLVQRLLVDLFKFMEPYLRNAELSDPVRLLYKGTLRVLLVLLHDFPEFLCDYHFSFCDVIPPSCIQMRNLILSAFPRNMRLPDPFTPNLKVDLLPEISQSPRILSEVDAVLKTKQLKTEVDEYLKTRQPMSIFIIDLKQRVLLPQHEAVSAGTRYNVPLINSLVLYVGMQAIQQLQSKTTPQQLAVPTAPITHSAPMDIFQRLILELDTEGRYLFLNAVANQLRYPNNHTHYFSCVLLYLFAEANQEIIQEQITRVLLERLIVNRPHPWGLLITFIELIKNPRYNFWNRGFTHCAPEIEKLFESVARSCMGQTMKPVEDDIASSISTESNH